MFTVNITQFLQQECMRDYSASVAEIGADAGAYTWQACIDNAPDWNFIPEDKFDHFKDWVQSSGGWTRDEIAEWSDNKLQALCLQWIASDARQCGLDKPAPDWAAIRADRESGRIPSSIYCADDGQVFWECT